MSRKEKSVELASRQENVESFMAYLSFIRVDLIGIQQYLPLVKLPRKDVRVVLGMTLNVGVRS